ncbi:COX15/CtaA family protein [Neolewinella agarilytica]|uniref:Cytochrome c oxidase assembly protein subunit 15 n=1 Tax=Neolewinella agarilytica TaxID=478744 RepID=A0A1H9EXV9_9BACT|nr:COX15/CtaA family protein [Neolewinella agarilytica]SEQ30564.1 cytochrome c oxidase assembly protein subunit 15 [Neolewinella agarilytica]
MEASVKKTDGQPNLIGGGYHRAVKIWLIVGLIMVVGQIVIGGITRLTESGLSITEWEPLSGAMPPLNAADWQVEFEKYQASPQYEKIFADITMEDFKFIYFWEWFHRQWARMMGLVFAVGFAIFWRKGWLDGPLMRRLGITVLLAALAASFGWIMVASGLIDRPWVNAYKLTIHLCLGISLFSYLLWTILKVIQPKTRAFPHSAVDKWLWPLNIVLFLQLILGGIMSGAKAALPYPTWPDMNGHFVPPILHDASAWTVDNLVYYEQSLFQPALIQFLHRMTAYTLIIMVIAYLLQTRKAKIGAYTQNANTLLIILLITQAILGIATVMSSQGQVPVGLGVAHQFGAIALVGAIVYLNYLFRPGTLLKAVDKTVENVV